MSGRVHPAESGTELLARLEGRSSLKEIEPTLFAEEDTPAQGHILELHGPEGTGKTEMLYHMTACCILPRGAGGLEAEALFIDTDHHFDLLRLVTVLEHRLPGGSEGCVRGCLRRLWVLRCGSSTQLLLTLHSLPELLCRHPGLSLLLVDSLSTFYWMDRALGGENVRLQEAPLHHCAQLLEQLVGAYRLLLFATTQNLMQGRPGDQNRVRDLEPNYRPYLCQAWQRAVRYRLFFSRHHDEECSLRFSVVSRHVAGHTMKRQFFIVGESGVRFC